MQREEGEKMEVRQMTGGANEQLFEKIDAMPYVRADGLAIHLNVWRTNCADCGTAFTFTTPSTAVEFKPIRRCKDHRKPGRRAHQQVKVGA
jgi:hypothetical protein